MANGPHPVMQSAVFWTVMASIMTLPNSGCLRMPSARFTSPAQPTRAVSTTAAPPVAGTRAAPDDDAPLDPATAGTDTRAVPSIASCPDGQCPPLIVMPAIPHIPCLLWPFCHKTHESLLESEMRAPLGRFHPVPTQSVFSPRLEYSAPEPLATAASDRHHLIAPRLLPGPTPHSVDLVPPPRVESHR